MSSPRPPLAAIDAGSNTIHLTVARPLAHGRRPRDLDVLADVAELVRLGADVAATGAIGPERMARAVVTIANQRARAESLGAQTILGMATEGVRAASNGEELLARARDEAGVTMHLISGDQEAALTYWGATSGAPDDSSRRAVIDLGGGSMELVVGEEARLLWRVSLPIGSGALLGAYVTADPPSMEDLERVRMVAADVLRPLAPPLPVEAVVACGGTATTLVLLARQALAPASTTPAPAVGDQLPGIIGVLSSANLDALVSLLVAQPSAETAARYEIPPARAPLLAPGALALLAALDRLGANTMSVSLRGIREGAILAYAHRADEWLNAAAEGSL